MRQDPGDRIRPARKAVIFNMSVRKYRSEDLSEILKLFYDTVHSVCKADYTLAQLDAWAPRRPIPNVGALRLKSITRWSRWQTASSRGSET